MAEETKEPEIDLRSIEYVDYKNVDFLKRFLNEQGKMMPRRVGDVPAKTQRMITRAVKRARHLSLLPFVADTTK